MKMMNPDYKEIGIVPFDIEVRNKIGISLELDQIEMIDESIDKLLRDDVFSKESIRVLREKYLYNVGKSASVGANYLIRQLIDKSKGKQ